MDTNNEEKDAEQLGGLKKKATVNILPYRCRIYVILVTCVWTLAGKMLASTWASEGDPGQHCKLRMGCGMTIVDRLLTRAFYHIGVFVGTHPGYFVIIPVILTALCATGYQRINYQIDPEYLFSPINGPGKYERAVVEEFFKPNYTSRFNVGRITRPGRFGRIIAIPKDGGDMLRVEVFKELRLLDQMIQNVTAHFDDEDFTYRDICAKWIDECFQNDILNLDHVMDEIESKELNLTFPIMFNPVTWDAHAFPVFFGGTKVNEDSLITAVPSLQLVYFVRADNVKQDARGAAWEDAFLDVVGKAEERNIFKYISTARFASRTLDIELERNTRTVVPYFGSTFALMCIFCIVTCMMSDWVRSKPLLGLMGTVSAAMACIGAFGFAMYLDFDFIGINLAAPFLMVGIGIDDTFVMLAAWRKTPVTMSVPQRMGLSMSDAAVSITITSVTDIVSFFIGVYSPFRSVQLFCIYSGFAVLFTFVWHLTFFSGCLAISAYCEKKNLHSIFCFKVKPKSQCEKKSWMYKTFCSGGINPDDPDNPMDNREHALMAFFRDTVAFYLNKGWVKFIVIMTFAAYLAGAFYGITTLEEGLQRRKLSRADSYSVEFYDREDIYFREFPYRIQVIVSGDYNYSDPWTQNEFEKLAQSFENSSYVSSSLYTESWVRSFISYVRRNGEYLNVTIDTEDDFVRNLKELWLLKPNPFSLDVKFNKDETRILATRFMVQAVNISDGNHEKEMVKALRQIAHASPLNVTVFHPYFVFFDQFELVRPTAIQCMVVGAIIMMIISFIFIPDMLCGIWVAFSIVSIEAGVAGYMAMWDVRLDSISMINIIMCIGFSVDFTAHICYAYMSCKSKDPKERVRESLYSLGLPIVQGSFSTILAVVALILADSYIFLVFFKMVFLVIFFGAMHGLFLLPVLLSLFGPGACSKHEEEMSPVEKTLPFPYCIPHPSLITNNNWEFSEKKPYLPTMPTHLNMATYERTSPVLDKDLGLGTSGEESSETNSGSGGSRGSNNDGWRRRYDPQPFAYAPRRSLEEHPMGRSVDDSQLYSHRRPSRGVNRRYSQHESTYRPPNRSHSNFAYTPDF